MNFSKTFISVINLPKHQLINITIFSLIFQDSFNITITSFILFSCMWVFCVPIFLWMACMPDFHRSQKSALHSTGLEPQTILNYYMGPSSRNQILWGRTQCFYLLSHPSLKPSPQMSYKITVVMFIHSDTLLYVQSN